MPAVYRENPYFSLVEPGQVQEGYTIAEFEESASLNVSFNQNMDETSEEEQLSLSKNFKDGVGDDMSRIFDPN